MSTLSELFGEVMRLKKIKGDDDFQGIMDQACLVVKRRRAREDSAFLQRMAEVFKKPFKKFNGSDNCSREIK